MCVYVRVCVILIEYNVDRCIDGGREIYIYFNYLA